MPKWKWVNVLVGCLWLAWMPLHGQGMPATLKDLLEEHEVQTYALLTLDGAKVSSVQGGASAGGGRYRVGSIGKVVVAIGLLKLEQEGRLSLEDPVSKYLPELGIDNKWEVEAPLRIEHLLEHSGGLDDMHYAEYYCPDDCGSSLGSLEAWKTRRLRWAPGSWSAYSNVGYAIAGAVIERVTGSPSAVDWLEQEVMRPIGMDSSTFDDGHLEGEVISAANGRVALPSPTYRYAAAIGLVSTPQDMLELLRFLDGGRGRNLLSEQARARLLQHRTTPLSMANWWEGARGPGLSLWGLSNDAILRISGSVDGFQAEMALFPGLSKGWVYVGTAAAEPALFSQGLTTQMDAIFPNERILTNADSRLIQMDGLQGHYRHVSLRNEVMAYQDYLYADLQLTQGGMHYHAQNGDGQELDLEVIGGLGEDYILSSATAAIAWQGGDHDTILNVQGRSYRKDRDPWPGRIRGMITWYGRLFFLGLFQVLVFWVGKLGKWKWVQGTGWLAQVAVLPYGCGWLGHILLRDLPVTQLGYPTMGSVGLAALSVALPLATLGSGVAWVVAIRRVWKQGWAARTWMASFLPLLVANVGLTLYLVKFEMLPFISWLY